MQNLFFLPFSPGLVVSYDKKYPIKMQQIAMLVNNEFFMHLNSLE